MTGGRLYRDYTTIKRERVGGPEDRKHYGEGNVGTGSIMVRGMQRQEALW